MRSPRRPPPVPPDNLAFETAGLLSLAGSQKARILNGDSIDADSQKDTRMFKKVVQRGRSKREGEAYSLPYVEPLSDARTKLETFFNIL